MKFEILRHVYKANSEHVNRLIIGEQMGPDSSKIKKYKPKATTGTIGYMDYQVRKRLVPKKENITRSEKEEDFIEMKSFTILLIAFEPDSRGEGHLPKVIDYAHKLAKKYDCECIVYDTIQNKKSLSRVERYGFKLFFNNAVKYL